ncbi:MAG TPA: T9SS type A sorting domain-containing protein, partial [Ignavibacteriaceae bacterium]|nr:T9SS type A sorting domain-containing protein [Ignavibacteriaceae bacterium]
WASWTTGYTSASQTKNGFIRTTDGGETWSGGELTDYDGGLCEWMEAIDANTAFIAIQNYMKSGVQGIYKTTDGGVTWQKHPTAFAGSSIGPAYIHFFDSNNGVVVGDKDAKTAGFRIYTTTNGGTEWNVVPQSNIPPLFSGEMLQPTPNGEFMDCIWLSTFPASGHTARIFKTTDKGFHWSVITPSGLTNSHLLSLAFQSATTGMMVAFSQMGSVIKKTKDGGETWTIVNGLDKCSPLFICHVQGADSAYLIGGNRNFMGYANGGSAYTLNDGETWTAIDTGDYAYPVFISPNIGWCGSFGENKIYKSSDIIINSITSVKEDIKSGKINSFSLEQNFPNPFNPSTTIRYSVKQSSNVNITILNAIGQVVTTLLNEEKSPGEYQVNFNASSLPSGVYFYRIKAGEYTSVKKMVLMK